MSESQFYVVTFGSVPNDWLEWARFAESISTRMGLPLTHYGSTRTSAPNGGGAKRFTPKGVGRVLQASDIRCLEFYSAPEHYTQLVFDWCLTLARCQARQTPGSVFFGCDSGLLVWQQFVELIAPLLKHLDGCYGFGGCLSRHKAPAFFVEGFGTGRQTAEENEELCRWGQDLLHARRFEQGLFRAAFRLNLLSDLHLAQPVGSVALASAIAAGIVPGSLKRINESISLWEIPEDGLVEAQRILEENNLIV